MPKDNEIRKANLLIVEGNHERDFFNAWLETLGKDSIQVMPIGGKTQLDANLKSLTKQSNFPEISSIIIVRDADDNPTGAFQSVCNALARAGLSTPSTSLTFTQNTTPKIGIVIMPAADRNGALEELLLPLASGDPLASEADQYIDEAVSILDNSGHRPPPPPHRRGKARVHAFLATFEHPDQDLGKAALAGVWNFSNNALDPIREMIQDM